MAKLARIPANYGAEYDVDWLRPEEVERLLAATGKGTIGARDRALISIIWCSGIRASEACDLRVRDIDVVSEHATVTVRCGKNGKRRVVALMADAIPAIEMWLEAREAHGLGDAETLLCSVKGARLNPSQVRRLFTRLGTKAGIGRRVHAHMLRHTLAHELALDGVGVALIQRQLGHSNLQTTTTYLASIGADEVVAAIGSRTRRAA